MKQEGRPITFQFEDALLLFPTRPSGFDEVKGEVVAIADLPAAAPPLGYMSDCYRFTPEDVVLPTGTTVTIGYQPGRVGWCPERQVAIYRYDPKLGEWTRLQSEVDTEAKTVRAEISRLGLFALSGEIIGEDATPPSVKLLSPVSGERIWEPVDISVQAYDDNGVAVTRLILDDEVVGYDLDGSDGWSVDLDPTEYSAGKHTLAVEAEDGSGNVSEVSIELIFGPALRGDLDGNGKLGVADVVIALRCAVGREDTTPERLQVGDLNGNGRIEISEAVQILRAALRLGTL